MYSSEESVKRILEEVKDNNSLKADIELLINHYKKVIKERDNLKLELQKLRRPPLFVGKLKAVLDDNTAVVSSTTGPSLVVPIDQNIPLDELVPDCWVKLHQRNFAILGILPQNLPISLQKNFVTEFPRIKALQDQFQDRALGSITIKELMGKIISEKDQD